MNTRQLHLVTGSLGLALFVLTGQYMASVIEVPELDDAQRLLYRSSHIYLLLAAVINVVAGCYMTREQPLNPVQRICSGLLMALPLLLTYSFFVEPQTGDLERPITKLSLYLVFGIAILLITNQCLHTLTGRRQ